MKAHLSKPPRTVDRWLVRRKLAKSWLKAGYLTRRPFAHSPLVTLPFSVSVPEPCWRPSSHSPVRHAKKRRAPKSFEKVPCSSCPAFIGGPRWPGELARTMPEAVAVGALISAAIGPLKAALSVHQIRLPLPIVAATIRPFLATMATEVILEEVALTQGYSLLWSSKRYKTRYKSTLEALNGIRICWNVMVNPCKTHFQGFQALYSEPSGHRKVPSPDFRPSSKAPENRPPSV